MKYEASEKFVLDKEIKFFYLYLMNIN